MYTDDTAYEYLYAKKNPRTPKSNKVLRAFGKLVGVAAVTYAAVSLVQSHPESLTGVRRFLHAQGISLPMGLLRLSPEEIEEQMKAKLQKNWEGASLAGKARWMAWEYMRPKANWGKAAGNVKAGVHGGVKDGATWTVSMVRNTIWPMVRSAPGSAARATGSFVKSVMEWYAKTFPPKPKPPTTEPPKDALRRRPIEVIPKRPVVYQKTRVQSRLKPRSK